METAKLVFPLGAIGLGDLYFEFDTKHSHCHSFNDNPPKSWEEVYKVYYSYNLYAERDGEKTELFNAYCDEGSSLDAVGYALQEPKKKYYCILPFGDGIMWEISRRYEKCEITLVEMISRRAYRIYLANQEAKKFGKFLVSCCEYMLAHGEGI